MYTGKVALSYASKSTPDLEWNINEDLVYLKEYFVINKLSLNIQKCEFLTVGTQHHLSVFQEVLLLTLQQPMHFHLCSLYKITVTHQRIWEEHSWNQHDRIMDSSFPR